MPSTDSHTNHAQPTAGRQWFLLRELRDVLSISLSAIITLLVGGGIYQFYETDGALFWNPNLVAATAYIWPSCLFLALFIWGMRRIFGHAQKIDPRITMGAISLVYALCFGAILYFFSRVIGLPDFEIFAEIGALLMLYPLLRFTSGRTHLRGLLILSMPGIFLGAGALGWLERRYLLVESMGVQYMDPNAQLLLVLTFLCLAAGLALVPYIAGRAMRKKLCNYPSLCFTVSAALILGTAALLWLNRAILVPRLYLETHLILGFFEWILLLGAFGWFWLTKPRSSRPESSGFSLKIVLLGGLFLASNAVLLLRPPTPDQLVPRRSDYLSELFAQPYLLLGFDSDGDGYLSQSLGGIDCDDTRARVNPLARERADNGIDDNCTNGDARATKITAPTVEEDGNARLVIVISIDMLRPDFMQVYGADEPTTPYLQANRDEWTRFERAYTSGGITTLALPSLLRGRIPLAIDFAPAYRTLDYRYVFSDEGDAINRVFASPRADKHTTIGDVFQRAGRPTRAIVDDGAAGIFQKGFGFEQGFDVFQYPNLPEGPGPDAWNLDTLTDTAVSLIEDNRAEGFWWLHIYDPHAAYPPCRDFAATPGLGCYRDAIQDADQAIGRIAEALRAAGQWEDTAVFITSDHGEALGEHGTDHHGLDSYEEYVHIPLIVKYPTSKAAPGLPRQEDVLKNDKIISRPVSLIDVSTTALAVAGLQPPTSFQGEDLRRMAEGQKRRSPVISQTLITNTKGEPYRQQTLVVDGTSRLMIDRITQKSWFFELAEDPAQKTPFTVSGVGRPKAQSQAIELSKRLLNALEKMEAADPISRPTKFP